MIGRSCPIASFLRTPPRTFLPFDPVNSGCDAEPDSVFQLSVCILTSEFAQHQPHDRLHYSSGLISNDPTQRKSNVH